MRRRLSQAELVEAHAPHIAPLIIAAIVSAVASAATAAAQTKAANIAKSRARSQAGVGGQGDFGTGFRPSADQFMKNTNDASTPAGQAFKELMDPGPTGTAADTAIMQATPVPEATMSQPWQDVIDRKALALSSPTYADANLQAQDQALGTASADPAVADAAAAASTGGTPAAGGGMDLASIMPWVSMAAQVGGAISESKRPQPVALRIGHMGGYQSTVPDVVERLRQALAAQRRR